MSTIIEDVRARRIFDSRGGETIEVEVETMDGLGIASAPSGASVGRGEVKPFPEGGVDEAIRKVREVIAPELVGIDAENQTDLDSILHEIDGTDDFGNIGGNVAFALSLGAAEAAADSYGMYLFQYLGGNLQIELPLPLGNVLGGGKHAGGSATDIQEFLTIPLGARSFPEAAELNVMVYRKIGRLLGEKVVGFAGGKGDEGAWTADIDNDGALNIVDEAVEAVSEETGVESRFGLDVAASSLWDESERVYVYSREGVKRDSQEQFEFIKGLIENYNLAYVEDPFHEEDFESFTKLNESVDNCLICGDDLFVTNEERLERGISLNSANSIIIKVNQVGTLTDAWRTVRRAKMADYVTVVSHRSGETTDTKIAHLAVAFRSPIIKTGVVGGERVSKINELLRILEAAEDRAVLTSFSI